MSSLSITWTIARLTLMRLVRGRALWVSGLIAGLPVAFAYVLSTRDRPDMSTIVDVFAFEQLVLAVLPALFIASSIGEEIEERTTTYLWSRPIPRWAVFAGKLIALLPIVCVLSVASWFTASMVGLATPPTAISCVALALGAIGLSLVAAAIATLVPKYAMALTICYMLFFDVPLGVMPASIKHVSITHHVRMIADVISVAEDTVTSGIIGIAIIAFIWTVVGLWRIRRLEA
jgi:ABC-2 type transport system permease protein